MRSFEEASGGAGTTERSDRVAHTRIVRRLLCRVARRDPVARPVAVARVVGPPRRARWFLHVPAARGAARPPDFSAQCQHRARFRAAVTVVAISALSPQPYRA